MEMQLQLNGLIAKECLVPKTYTIGYNDGESDSITSIEKKAKGGGNFTQYALHIVDNGTQETTTVPFLFMRDFEALIKGYGTDSLKWVGRKVIVTAEVDKSKPEYHNFILTPIM